MWGSHDAKVRYGYDPAQGREVVARRRRPPTQKLRPGTKVYKLYAPTTPRPYISQPERVARFLQAGLAQAGIKTELVLQPYMQHRASTEKGEHDLALFGWIGDTGDPDNFLYTLFDRDNAIPGEAQNIAFYSVPRVDELLVQAQATAASTR